MNNKKVSNRQERKIAKEMGARVTIASGAFSFQKADVRNDVFLVEAKTTAKDTYQLTSKTWNTIKEQALRDGMRIPLMCIELNNNTSPVSVAILDANDFEVVKEHIDTLEVKSTLKDRNKSIMLRETLLIGRVPLNYHHGIAFHSIFFDKHRIVLVSWSDFLLIQKYLS